jgi:hypothetical protein
VTTNALRDPRAQRGFAHRALARRLVQVMTSHLPGRALDVGARVGKTNCHAQPRDLGWPELLGLLLAMEQNVPPDTADVRVLGPPAVVARSEGCANAVEEPRLGRRSATSPGTEVNHSALPLRHSIALA